MEGTVPEQGPVEQLQAQLFTVIHFARSLNAQNSPTRSRELSLAITQLEQANHWIREIVDFDGPYPDKRPS